MTDVAKERKPTAAERQVADEYGRAMAIRAAGMEFHLESLCRHFTQEEVLSIWHRVNGGGETAASTILEDNRRMKEQLRILLEGHPTGGWLLDDQGNVRPEKGHQQVMP
jgi:hypothetical protein